MNQPTNRRHFLGATGTVAAAGLSWAFASRESTAAPLPLEGPGLGVTIDEERAKAKPFRPPTLQPRLNATDGSVRDF